jgi:hypothetical protein
MEGTGGFTFGLARRRAFRAVSQFPPLARAGPVASFKTGVKKTKVVEPALLGDIDDFLAGISQKGYRLQKADLHSQRGNGQAEMLVE